MKFTAPKRYGSAVSKAWLVEFSPADFPARAAIEAQVGAHGYLLGDNYEGTSASIFLAAAATVDKQRMLTFLDTHDELVDERVPAAQRELAAVGQRFGFEPRRWRMFARQVQFTAVALSELDRFYYAAYLLGALGEQRAVYSQDLVGVLSKLTEAKRSPILTSKQVDALVAVSHHLAVTEPLQPVPALAAKLLTTFLSGEIEQLLAAGLNAHKLGRVAAIRGELGYEASVEELIDMVSTMRDSWFANLLGEAV